MMARTLATADDSLPAMRARIRPGTATAAMMPMMATTIRSSIRVKPSFLDSRIVCSWTAKSSPPQSVRKHLEVRSAAAALLTVCVMSCRVVSRYTAPFGAYIYGPYHCLGAYRGNDRLRAGRWPTRAKARTVHPRADGGFDHQPAAGGVQGIRVHEAVRHHSRRRCRVHQPRDAVSRLRDAARARERRHLDAYRPADSQGAGVGGV